MFTLIKSATLSPHPHRTHYSCSASTLGLCVRLQATPSNTTVSQPATAGFGHGQWNFIMELYDMSKVERESA